MAISRLPDGDFMPLVDALTLNGAQPGGSENLVTLVLNTLPFVTRTPHHDQMILSRLGHVLTLPLYSREGARLICKMRNRRGIIAFPGIAEILLKESSRSDDHVRALNHLRGGGGTTENGVRDCKTFWPVAFNLWTLCSAAEVPQSGRGSALKRLPNELARMVFIFLCPQVSFRLRSLEAPVLFVEKEKQEPHGQVKRVPRRFARSRQALGLVRVQFSLN
jgi:hypothetical protein